MPIARLFFSNSALGMRKKVSRLFQQDRSPRWLSQLKLPAFMLLPPPLTMPIHCLKLREKSINRLIFDLWYTYERSDDGGYLGNISTGVAFDSFLLAPLRRIKMYYSSITGIAHNDLLWLSRMINAIIFIHHFRENDGQLIWRWNWLCIAL